MRSSLIATKGLKLVRTPSARVEAHRRRLMVLGAILGLALLSIVGGYLAAPSRAADPVRTGPFSYFPSQ